ncbi:2-oxoglutarate (2OG) and Fe(II)-dependent oxygenase superfamily protein [Artemisia annua]|uniref:2-oxoglutarate (2OG) and Fe(II)-dependent oxygenase superfamily protein n=1 Tax=Artemisia annua TaxID=35608 RepID=A0A2U1LJM3_ARTAN|nr:2-oxoglutarate (2OG) and Fe(II)-dependent oxygenase superfamily protein [Artemisia annua]
MLAGHFRCCTLISTKLSGKGEAKEDKRKDTRAREAMHAPLEESRAIICNITEILSRGRVCATPHCVRAPKGDKATRLERSTFAFGQ